LWIATHMVSPPCQYKVGSPNSNLDLLIAAAFDTYYCSNLEQLVHTD
jgi:hypothetical protein